MTSTLGQRTKAYFGLRDDEHRVSAPSVSRQAAVTVAWFLAGILIWSVWSATVGSWVVVFGVITLVVIPMVRHLQHRADQRRNSPAE